MTARDFTQWLSGFAAGLTSPPNAEQWELVQAKAAEIELSAPISIPSVFGPTRIGDFNTWTWRETTNGN